MWVRSQNKKRIINCDGFTITNEGNVLGFQGAEDEGVCLGKYDNEDEALKVLDYICKFLQNNVSQDTIQKGTKYRGENIFQMPKKVR